MSNPGYVGIRNVLETLDLDGSRAEMRLSYNGRDIDRGKDGLIGGEWSCA